MMNFIDPSKMLKINKKSVIKTWIITIQELWRKERYLTIEIIWKKRKVFKSHRLSERQRITHKEKERMNSMKRLECLTTIIILMKKNRLKTLLDQSSLMIRYVVITSMMTMSNLKKKKLEEMEQ